MGIAGGIDQHSVMRFLCLVNPADQLALAIALSKINGQVQLCSHSAAQRLDVGEGVVAVDLRLARAQQVEIGAVENENGTGHGESRLLENKFGKPPLPTLVSAIISWPLPG